MKKINRYKHLFISINRRTGKVEKVQTDQYPYRTIKDNGTVLRMDFPVMPGGSDTKWIDTNYYKRLMWRFKNGKELIDKKNEVHLNFPAPGEPKNLLLNQVEFDTLKRLSRIATKRERKKTREFIKQSEKRLLKQIYKDCPQVFDKDCKDRTPTITKLAGCFNTTEKRIKHIIASAKRKKRRIKNGTYQFRRRKETVDKARQIFSAKVKIEMYRLFKALERERQSYSTNREWYAWEYSSQPTTKQIYEEAVAAVKAKKRPEAIKTIIPIPWKDFMATVIQASTMKLIKQGYRKIKIVKPRKLKSMQQVEKRLSSDSSIQATSQP